MAKKYGYRFQTHLICPWTHLISFLKHSLSKTLMPKKTNVSGSISMLEKACLKLIFNLFTNQKNYSIIKFNIYFINQLLIKKIK